MAVTTRLVPLNLLAVSTAPTTTKTGDLYLNTSNNTVYVYTGASWVAVGSGGSSYATTATAAGTTTLTVASAYAQFFTGSANQTVALPVASTMTLGGSFYINNNSTGTLTVNSSGGNLVVSIPANTTVVITCILTSGTSAASWGADFSGATTITGTGSLVLATAPTISLPTIDNFKLGYSTTVTAAGTTTLTASSNNQQLFSGTSTQTVVMPVASTMTVGTRYSIENNSTGVVTVQSSGLNTIVAIVPGTSIKITSILASGTGAASWDYEYVGFNTLTGTGANVLATSPSLANLTLTGTLTAGASVGASGQVLTSTVTGVQWAAAAADATPTVFMLMGA